MLKTLIRKQILESSQFIFFDSRKGKRREGKSLIGYSVLMIVLVVYLLGVFYFAADMLAEQLIVIGFDWFYYLLIALIGIIYGVLGSAFTTYSGVYLSKDNDLLLSMPIPTKDLVISRLAGVYVMGLGYSGMVLIPGIIAGQINSGFHAGILIASIVMTFACSLFVLALSALLGYVVAKISVLTRSKAYITVIISLIAIGIYFYIYNKLLNGLENLIYVAANLAKKIENHLLLFYHLGKGFTGNIQSIGIIFLVVIICTILSYYLIERNFNSLVTTNKGEKKTIYKEEKKKQKSIQSALLQREFLHLSKSAAYMLNCALGTIILILAGIMVMIKADQIQILIEIFGQEITAPGIAGMVMLVSTMNNLTTPSISLEGKSFYILQSLPIDLWDIVMAKLKMHLYLTIIPCVFAVICSSAALNISLINCILITLACILFNVLYAVCGMILSIRFVNLNWTNETAAVKQNFAVLIELFGGWGVIFSLGIIAYFLLKTFDFMIVISLISILLALLCAGSVYLLKNKESKKLADL